jgi:hypothetical protein
MLTLMDLPLYLLIVSLHRQYATLFDLFDAQHHLFLSSGWTGYTEIRGCNLVSQMLVLCTFYTHKLYVL